MALTTAAGTGDEPVVNGIPNDEDTVHESNRHVKHVVTPVLSRPDPRCGEPRPIAAAAHVADSRIETREDQSQTTVHRLEVANAQLQTWAAELNDVNAQLRSSNDELGEIVENDTEVRIGLEAILACIGEAVLVVNHQGQVVVTNLAYDSLLETFGGVLRPTDEHGEPVLLDATLLERAARGETFRVDFTATTADGVRYWFEASGRPLREGDAGAGVVVIRDISDRNVRMLQGEFLAWAAHELRTPLTLFKGYLQMAVQRVGPDGDARLLHYLNRASEHVNQQAALVEDLLDTTRLETGRFTLRTEMVDLTVLATHVVEIIQILAQGQAITLEAEEGVFLVAGDTARLEQVLLNLLTNAIAYAPGTERIIVTVGCDGDSASIAVRDFGPGIPANKQASIFTRYVKGSQDEYSGTRGLGLGLYIAREIVRAHGGTIAVTSVLGEGTTFTVRLPLSANPNIATLIPAVERSAQLPSA